MAEAHGPRRTPAAEWDQGPLVVSPLVEALVAALREIEATGAGGSWSAASEVARSKAAKAEG